MLGALVGLPEAWSMGMEFKNKNQSDMIRSELAPAHRPESLPTVRPSVLPNHEPKKQNAFRSGKEEEIGSEV
jgi:hypothetical protein